MEGYLTVSLTSDHQNNGHIGFSKICKTATLDKVPKSSIMSRVDTFGFDVLRFFTAVIEGGRLDRCSSQNFAKTKMTKKNDEFRD